VSATALDFTRRRLWCEWQFEEALSPRREADLFEAWARVKRDAAFLIGFMA
jgi:hypothetical protein